MQAADNLIKEFCQSIGMNPLGLDDENQRSLSFDDKLIVTFIGDQDDSVTALCFIGELKKDADMRIFLEQNFMPDAHGGARFSLEPKSDRIVMACRWNALRIDLASFSKDLETFINSGMRAQEFLDKGGVIDKPAASANAEVGTAPAANESTLAAYQNML